MVLGYTRGSKYINHRKNFDYIIAIVFIRAITYAQNKSFLPEGGFDTQSINFLILLILCTIQQ
jgi:hypothetical protein